ncbi:Glutamate--tRNA ligase [Bienertia sinuspersici]
MGSSRKWAKAISSFASRFFFLLIIFQVPLFRVPCRSGICITPVEVTSSQLIATEMLPDSFVKILLYPGAIANALIKGVSIPNYNDLIEFYNLDHVKEASAIIDLMHLEILAGSYFCVTGAILGLLKHGQISLLGMLLLIWGLIKGVIRQNATCLNNCEAVRVSPVMLVALLTALSCIKGDVRVIIKSFRVHHSATTTIELHEDVNKKKKKEREMKRLEWTVNDVNSSKTPRCTKVAQEGISNAVC